MRATTIRGLALVLPLALAACGGGGAGGNGPTSGEYLFEGNSSSSLNLATINSSTGALGTATLAAGSADDSVIYPGVAVSPSNSYLYAFWTSFTVIDGFAVTGPGFQLAPLPGSPFFLSVSSGSFNTLVMHPSGKFLYAVQAPATIEVISVDQSNGSLATASVTTEAADFRVAAVDPPGRFLFVADLTGSRIFAYQVNQSDGSLSTAAGSPFSLPADSYPSIVVVDSTGKYLYALLNAGGIAAFVINTSTGALTTVPGSPFPTTNSPVYIAVDPADSFIYVCDSDGSVDGFAIDTTSGGLTAVMGSPFSTAQAASNIAVDPSGKFVYVSIESEQSIYGFGLDPSTGSLSPLSGSPFASIPNPTNLFIVDVQ